MLLTRLLKRGKMVWRPQKSAPKIGTIIAWCKIRASYNLLQLNYLQPIKNMIKSRGWEWGYPYFIVGMIIAWCKIRAKYWLQN